MEESAFHQWYRTYYVRRLRTIPGVQRVTRYAAREGSPRYLTLVEMQNTEVAMGNRFQTLGTRLKERQVPIHTRKLFRHLAPPLDAMPRLASPAKAVSLQLVTVPTDLEQEYNEFYDKEHLADTLRTPGYARARRFLAVDPDPSGRYAVIYEMERLDAMTPEHVHRLQNTPWAKKMDVHRFVNLFKKFSLMG